MLHSSHQRCHLLINEKSGLCLETTEQPFYNVNTRPHFMNQPWCQHSQDWFYWLERSWHWSTVDFHMHKDTCSLTGSLLLHTHTHTLTSWHDAATRSLVFFQTELFRLLSRLIFFVVYIYIYIWVSIVQVTISVFACARISGIWCCALSINLISSIFRWHILNYFLWLSVSLFVSLWWCLFV